MKWFEKKKPPAAVVQTREEESHPFGALNGYVPLKTGEIALYRTIREAVPIVDAAVGKLVRLAGGVKVTADEGQRELEEFLRTVNTGRGQRGIQSFLDAYVDSMLVCGRGVGEVVMDGRRREVAALLCADPAEIEIKREKPPWTLPSAPGGGTGPWRKCPGRTSFCLPPTSPKRTTPMGCPCCGPCRSSPGSF